MGVVSYNDYKSQNKERLTEENELIRQQRVEEYKKKKKREEDLANATPLQQAIATTLDFGGNIVQAGLNTAEGVSDWARYRYADVMDFFGNEAEARMARETAKESTIDSAVVDFKRLLQGDLEGTKSVEDVEADDFVNRRTLIDDNTKILGVNPRSVAQGMGSTLGFALMSGSIAGATNGISNKLLKGAADLAPIYMSSAGSGTTEAYMSGATDEEARRYGALSGAIEAGTEALFGGLGAAADSLGVSNVLGLGKGALDDKLIGAFTNRFKSTLMKNLVDLGIRGIGEGTEELLSDFFGAFAKKMTYMSEEDLGKLLKEPDYLESFMSGMLSSVLSQAPANARATIQGREATTGITKNENKVIDEVVNERIKDQNLSNKEINKIRNEVREDLQNGYISTDTIEKVLGKDYDVSDDFYLQESYNEKARRSQNFETDLTQYKNEAQRAIVQKAIDSGILNNSKKTHDFVDLVSKIAADKGMDFDFTNNEKLKQSGFAVDGKTVNGYVNGNTIGLNIDSGAALNRTVGHEITHVLEGTDLYNELQKSLKDFIGESEWSAKLKEVAETYKNVENANIEQELTADLVGDYLFNDVNFVRSLSTKNRNLFEKIFDEIKYLVKVATAGSQEARKLAKVQKIFQEAYRQNTIKNAETKYSVTGEIGYNNLNNALKKQNTYDAKLNQLYSDLAYQLQEAKDLWDDGKSNKEITDTGNMWYNDKGKWKIELSDSEANVDLSKLNNGNKTTLGDVLDHELLYLMYPNLKNIEVKYRKYAKKTTNGSYVANENTIYLNDKFKNNPADVKTTLMHEIQHAIQRAEGFENGTSSSRRLAYADSYGEAEAKLVGKRSNLTQDEINSSDVFYKAQTKEHLDRLKRYEKTNGKKASDSTLEKIFHSIDDALYKMFMEEGTNVAKNTKSNTKTSKKSLFQNFGQRNYEEGNGLEVDNTSFSLEQRVSGDKLLDAQDLIRDVQDVGAEVDDNGYVTVYHQTTDENAQKIRESGQMISNEPYVFFSTSKDAQQSQGRGETKLEFKIPAEDLILDDLFSDNADVKVDLKGNKSLDVSNYLVDRVSLEQQLENQGTRIALEAESKRQAMIDNFQEYLDEYDITNPTQQDIDNSLIDLLGYDNDEMADNAKNEQLYNKYVREYMEENNIPFNETKYSLTDNQGRELSKEQQEYFKDSKVRTPDGSLRVMYRGGGQEINVFDRSKARSSGQEGNGFYFTTSKEHAAQYGNAKEYYLNIVNPLADVYSKSNPLYGQKNLTREQLITLVDAMRNNEDYSIENYGRDMSTEQIVDNLLDKNNDYQMLKDLDYTAVGNMAEFVEFVNDTIGTNYDGIMTDYETVVLNSNQIKSVNNTNPTSNPDIRYSLTQMVDSEMEDITPEQFEYFKNTKAVDQDGELWQVHHGTPAEFNVFDIEKAGQTGLMFGNGFYFTNSPGAALAFTDGGLYGDNYDQVKTGYINIEKPASRDTKTMTYKEFKDLYEALNSNPNLYDEEMGMSNIDALLSDYGDIYNDKEGTIKAYYDSYDNDVSLIDNLSYMANPTEMYKTLREATGYDGIIVDQPHDYDSYEKYFIAFNPDQFKLKTNKTPTNNVDMRLSLTRADNPRDIAPIGKNEIRGEDIRLQVQDTIAPLQEQITELQNTIEDIRDNIAPITEEEAENLGSQFDENEVAPIRYNLTPEESQELDYLDTLPFDLTDEEQTRYDELREKELNTPEEEEMTSTESLNDVRDIDEVSSPKVNAYQYEHPEVKPYFQEEARVLLAELNEVIPGERFMIPGKDYLHPDQWTGYKRQASDDVAALLDTDVIGVKYTKDQLRKGLQAIIDDKGAENIAVAKRLEFMLDDRLRNGHKTIEGYFIEPNQGYLDMLKEQEWDNYYDQAPMPQIAPAEIQEPTIYRDTAPTREITPRETRDVMEMVDNEGFRNSTTYNQPRTIRKQKNALRQFGDAIQSNFINRNVEIDNLSKDSGNRNIKFAGDMLNAAMGEATYNINSAQTNNQGQAVGKSISDLFKQAKKEDLEAAFNDYLINYSNIDRYAQNKGSKTPLDVSKRLVRDYSIQYPQFKKWAKDVWNYGKNARQNLVDAGLIDQQLANYLGQIYPHYVPYVSDYANADVYFEGVGELKPKGLKRAKGGAGALLTVEDALARYTYAQKNAVRQNELYKEIVHTLGQIPSFGIDERTDYTSMKDSLYTDSRGNYLTAYENGKQITTQVSADLYKELSRVTEQQIKDFESKMSLLTKPLQKVSEIRKNLITTWNPTFPVTNAIKDIQDALFNSKHTLDMVKNYPGALAELATGKSKQVQQFLALYGSGLTMGEYSSDTMSQNTAKVPMLRKIRQVNEIIELAPRYAEFKASLEHGASLQEAMYNAREVTTNFNRGGTITKALNRNGFTFLNASVQGFDKLVRNFSGENGARGIVQALAKAVALGVAPALLNALVFGSGDDEDEDYAALPDYIKDNYYLIKTEDEKFIRIPKGRMLSIFGSAARRTLEATQGEENAFEGYLENAWSQVGVNNPAENNIFAPLLQTFGSENGEAWYGGDIVPTRLQDKPKGEQYDETTDKFSIWLGDKLNISPKKINYVLDQYSGGIGDVVLPMMTEAASSDASNVKDYLLAPMKDKFTADSVNDNKYVSDFYSKREELTVKSNGKDATDEEKVQKKYLDSISKAMTDLYKEKREVQSDSSLSKEEKYERATEIKRQINELAKEALDNYQDVYTSDSYAEVGGQDYQKDGDTWKKSSSSDTLNSLGLNKPEKTKYTETQNSINEIKNKYKGSSSEADTVNKKTDIINTIVTSGLTDDAKVQLYKEAYSDNMVDDYSTMGMDIDSYLNYKKQNFTADKDSSGKSISGSKKQKVFDYINSMNIPYEQKLILAKEQYNNFNDGNIEIINYLNSNPNIDYETMVDILKHLGFQVDGNNVSW